MTHLKVVLVCDARLPALKYGGTERVVQWLAQELVRRDHQVSVICRPGSFIPGARMIHVRTHEEAEQAIPGDTDIIHAHGWFPRESRIPQLNTRHGDDPVPGGGNWSFVSAAHARRLGRSTFVHNAMPLGEAYFSAEKSDRYLFFSRIHRRGKNVTRAIHLARKFGFDLDIAGGQRWELLTRSAVRKEGAFFSSLDRRFRFHGMVGGWQKNQLFAAARALLFPIRWEEPFGLVTIEALFAGTPVIATPRGAMPEIIHPDVGFLCETDEDFGAAFEKVGQIDPHTCREYAREHFGIERAADKYLTLYERIMAGETLP